MFEKINEFIDKLYRPFAEWLIHVSRYSFRSEDEIDWLKMSDDMIDKKEKNETL